MKSSKKIYQNKGGGTTIISKKTIIGGTQTNIGKNAGNVTINIGTGAGRKPKVKTDNHNNSESAFIFLAALKCFLISLYVSIEAYCKNMNKSGHRDNDIDQFDTGLTLERKSYLAEYTLSV